MGAFPNFPVLPPVDPFAPRPPSPLLPSQFPTPLYQGPDNFSNPTGQGPTGPSPSFRYWLQGIKLNAAVGPFQPNYPLDVSVLQRLINEAYSRGYIRAFTMPLDADGPGHTLAVNGRWTFGSPTNRAILDLEKMYFHGRANPMGMGVVNPDGDLFRFLVELVTLQRMADTHLAVGMEKLGEKMIPHAGMKNVRNYLPFLLDAMTQRNLNDTGMILVLLADIRCETEQMEPVDEGISHYNTEGSRTAPSPGHKTGVFQPSGELFGKYDHLLGNQGTGDGAKYKGRGFIQITGRTSYTDMGQKLNVDLVNKPELADDPNIAANIAAQYMKDREAKFREALRTNDMHYMRSLVNGNAELHYELFRSSFNDGRVLVGEEIISEATAAAAKSARLSNIAAAKKARAAAAAAARAKRHPGKPTAPGPRAPRP